MTWLRRVLFFGDSFVAGVGDETGLGWVGRVVAASFAHDLPLTAYNLGVRMEPSLAIADRWPAEARPRLFQGTDCRLVFSFGANDTTLDGDGTRVDPDRSVEAMSRMLRGAREWSLPVLVVGTPPAGDDIQHARISSLSRRFGDVCEECDVPYIEVTERLQTSSAWVDEARRGDGSHPGSAGYQELANLILEGGWLEWLRAPQPVLDWHEPRRTFGPAGSTRREG